MRELTPKLDRDGDQLEKDGRPLFNRRLRFSLYAAEVNFEQVAGGVPERVRVPVANTEQKKSTKPLPKPLT